MNINFSEMRIVNNFISSIDSSCNKRKHMMIQPLNRFVYIILLMSCIGYYNNYIVEACVEDKVEIENNYNSNIRLVYHFF